MSEVTTEKAEHRVTYVGMDVHKEQILACAKIPGQSDEEWAFGNNRKALDKFVRSLRKVAIGDILACYEAGPTGYVIQRRLESEGIRCIVVAPSLIPVKPGDRIKTDRRDARKLAQLLRSDTLTEVHPPTPEEEAARSLCRCREDAVEDQRRARQRLSLFVLSRGHKYSDGSHWTLKHESWLDRLKFDVALDQETFAQYLAEVRHRTAHLSELTKMVEALAQTEMYVEKVGWLRCFRGIDTITAMTLLAELFDLRRFKSAPGLMNYLGLVPSESTTGGKEVRGSITKAGNVHVRRLLIEAAWHYRHPPRLSAPLRRRRRGQPEWVIAHADKAQRRLKHLISPLCPWWAPSARQAIYGVW